MRNNFFRPCIFLSFFGVTLLGLALQSCHNETAKTIEADRKYVIPDSLLKTLHIDTVQDCPLISSITFTGMVDVNQDNQVNIFGFRN